MSRRLADFEKAESHDTKLNLNSHIPAYSHIFFLNIIILLMICSLIRIT